MLNEGNNQKELIIRYTSISKASPDTQKLKPAQRKCFFDSESHLKITSQYSKNMCELEIRLNNLLRKCHCLPHYVDYNKCKNIA